MIRLFLLTTALALTAWNDVLEAVNPQENGEDDDNSTAQLISAAFTPARPTPWRNPPPLSMKQRAAATTRPRKAAAAQEKKR